MEQEQGTALGITIIVVLAALMILPLFFGFEVGSAKQGLAAVLVGIYLQFWGVLFLLSYYFSHKTFFFRWLIWICEHFSNPRGRGMAFFYFSLDFGLCSVALLHGI